MERDRITRTGIRQERGIKKSPDDSNGQKVTKVIAFIAVFCLLASLAMVHGERLFGHDFRSAGKTDRTIVETSGGEIVNTSVIGKNIIGYGGPVPVDIYITGNRIDSVKALPNNESEEIFNRLSEAGLTRAWDGKKLNDALDLDVDAVTGATYSSNAYIANVRAGISYVLDNGASAGSVSSQPFSIVTLLALLVILAGAILPQFVHDPRYRLLQQLLNVGVLGFWSGTFIDYAMMLNFFENGPVFTLASVTMVVLLIVGFVYPLFGKSNYYCAWICPFGSLQELAGKINKAHKLKIGAATARFLDNLRQGLWVVLLLCLYTGVWASWIDYEIFTGFIVSSASWIVICVGFVFILLSVFIPRPFCRFVCPTGSLLKQI